MNAFRAQTVDELIHCLKRAWADQDVGVVCLIGAGERAFCTRCLGRVVGERRACEIWCLCRRYDAETAERWGLVDGGVQADELKQEVRRGADEILSLSPTALRFLKQSFNADTENLAGNGQ